MPTYIRLTEYKSSEEKKRGFFKPENRYEAKQEDFEKIPGSPIAYWVSDRVKEIFEKSEKLGEIAEPRQGMATSDNNRFLRYWNEVDFKKIGFNYPNSMIAKDSEMKWFPYNKGGEYQKWYGNQEYLINWENDGQEIMEYAISLYKNATRTIKNIPYYFKKGITYSFVSSSKFAVRYTPNGFLFDVGGSSAFPKKEDLLYLTSFLNSNIAFDLLKIVAPTINFQVGDLKALPIIFPKSPETKQKIDELTQQNIDISKEEWDSIETSWDFKASPLLMDNGKLRIENGKIEDAYNRYCEYWSEKFVALHKNEEELNRLFIEIYDLQDELDAYVDFEYITILKNETKIEKILIPSHTPQEAQEEEKTPQRYMYNRGAKLEFRADEIMKQFISYGVGVMFGRYSLDHEGLHIADMGVSLEEANSKFNIQNSTFEIDDDNIIPVLEDDYFKDDIASRFVQFVKATFGKEYLSENVRFIEKSLGKSLRRYFVKDFYEDHIKRYKKRPIYWMVSSPKKGFMALMYMHRYQSDTFARVRNSYLNEYIAKLEAQKENLKLTLNSKTASNKDKKDASKAIKKIEAKLKELIDFDRDVMMNFARDSFEIDLDDGVKVNYCRFRDILYPIKGLCK